MKNALYNKFLSLEVRKTINYNVKPNFLIMIVGPGQLVNKQIYILKPQKYGFTI